MARALHAGFALAVTLITLSAQGPSDRRLSVRLGGGRRVEVFRAVPLFRGSSVDVLVAGPGVEKATRVEARTGIEVGGASLRRSPGSLEFTASVAATAPVGAAELRLRFPIELQGPEVYSAVVLRSGRVDAVEPRRVPAGKRVVLTFTGAEIGNADVLQAAAYSGARVLPGGDETRCVVELTFARPGRFEVPLFDRAGIPKPAPSLDAPGGYTRAAAAFVEVTP